VTPEDYFKKQMSLFCELVRKEKAQDNFVYINFSSGSKLSAIAGTLAALMCQKDTEDTFIHN